MVVLEELDASKKGVSGVARNARQASRTLNELIESESEHALESGVDLPGTEKKAAGKLFFQTTIPTTKPH